MMKVAVTGASGHVGNVLCQRLVEEGIKVRALIHKNRDELDRLNIELFHGDLLDHHSIEELVKSVDVVFHLAAKITIDNKNSEQVRAINVQGTQHVIDACLKHKIKRLIHFSTIHTISYKNQEETVDETNPLIDHSSISYEQSKADAERLVLTAAKKGLDVVILNPTAIIGPYDFIPSYLGQALIRIYLNRLPMLTRGGYDFVDVRDVVAGAINAVNKGKSGERYILSGHWLSLREISQMISTISGKKTPMFVAHPLIARIGVPFIRFYAWIKSQDPLYTSQSLQILKLSARKISNDKAKQDLGYIPRPILESLKETFEWYGQKGMLE